MAQTLIKHNESTPDTTNFQAIRGHWKLQGSGFYALAIIDLTRRGLATSTPDNIFQNIKVQEFIFKTHPSSMSMEEPPAVTIHALQDGGYYVEHQGQLSKTITISGTTGMRPNRGRNGLIPVLGISLPPFLQDARDPITGLPPGERTGFEDLIDLRNLFREYWSMKKNPQFAHKTAMVWMNGKEGEFYIVEPFGQGFKSNREASSPMNYRYEIQLRTLGRFAWRLPAFQDAFEKRKSDGFLGAIERIYDVTKKINQSFTFFNSLIDRIATIGQAVLTGVTGPINAIVTGLNNFTATGARVLAIPRNTFLTTFNSMKELWLKLDGQSPFANQVNAYRQLGVTSQGAQVSHEIKTMCRYLLRLCGERSLFSRPNTEIIKRKADLYDDATFGPNRSSGSTSNLNNISPSRSARESVVYGGEDIRSIANRLLGDSLRWRELVILNNLKPPYISSAGDGISVLRAQDRILFPSNEPDPDTAVSSAVAEAPFRGASTLEERLGRDILLENVAGLDDIAIGSDGDIAKVSGVDNIKQAMRLKFATEPGELKSQPQYGVFLPIGTKMKNGPKTIVELQASIRSAVLDDARLKRINNLDVDFSGDTFSIQLECEVSSSDSALTMNLSVRR